MSTNVFGHIFDNVNDPRQASKVVYKLYDLLFLTTCAVISGWEDIRDFGEARLPWLKSLGLFKDGVPVDDTIVRLISRIAPEQLQKRFIKWMRQANTLTCGEVMAIVGKPYAALTTVTADNRVFIG